MKSKYCSVIKQVVIGTLLILAGTNKVIAVNMTASYQAKQLSRRAVNLREGVARLAIDAFNNSRKLGVKLKKPVVTLIDYSLPSTKKRLWVVDLERNEVLYSSLVAHGKNSGENYTTQFSNRSGSLQTSMGVFLTGQTYFGRDGYSLKIKGLEQGINDKAESRCIVVHGAPYVSEKFAAAAGRLGRSWGCPAVEKQLAEPIINTIKGGTLILSFYPDKNWLTSSHFINSQS